MARACRLALVIAAVLGLSLSAREGGVLLYEIGIHVEPAGLSNGRITTGRGTYADED